MSLYSVNSVTLKTVLSEFNFALLSLLFMVSVVCGHIKSLYYNINGQYHALNAREMHLCMLLFFRAIVLRFSVE